MLVSISEMITKSWTNYQKNWRSFVPYVLGMFFPSLLVYISGLVGLWLNNLNDNFVVFTSLLTVVVMIFTAVFLVIQSISFAFAIKASLVNEPIENWIIALKKSSRFFMPIITTSLLAGIIIFGGTLLLVIPGVIFAIWYSFITYSVIFDGKKNTNALQASKELVVGRWWAILGKMIVPAFVFSIASSIVAGLLTWPFGMIDALSLEGITMTSNVLTKLTGALFAPLLIGAQIQLYLSAKSTPVVTETVVPEIK